MNLFIRLSSVSFLYLLVRLTYIKLIRHQTSTNQSGRTSIAVTCLSTPVPAPQPRSTYAHQYHRFIFPQASRHKMAFFRDDHYFFEKFFINRQNFYITRNSRNNIKKSKVKLLKIWWFEKFFLNIPKNF